MPPFKIPLYIFAGCSALIVVLLACSPSVAQQAAVNDEFASGGTGLRAWTDGTISDCCCSGHGWCGDSDCHCTHVRKIPRMRPIEEGKLDIRDDDFSRHLDAVQGFAKSVPTLKSASGSGRGVGSPRRVKFEVVPTLRGFSNGLWPNGQVKWTPLKHVVKKGTREMHVGSLRIVIDGDCWSAEPWTILVPSCCCATSGTMGFQFGGFPAGYLEIASGLNMHGYSTEAVQVCLKAAKLEKAAIRKEFDLGAAMRYAKNWVAADLHFQRCYGMTKEGTPERAKIALEIFDHYADTHQSYEICGWATRYLPVAPDWESFDRVWQARASEQWSGTVEDLKHEDKELATWEPKHLPLKICFPQRGQSDWDPALQEEIEGALFQWMRAMKGRLNYKIVENVKEADVVCMWEDDPKEVAFAKDLNGHPVRPSLPHIGETLSSFYRDDKGKKHIDTATISIMKSLRMEVSDHLWLTCLHEVGHMLGRSYHSTYSNDIMAPCLPEQDSGSDFWDTGYLSANDKAVILKPYESYPVSQEAVERFIGLSAVCQKLEDCVEPLATAPKL